MSEKIELLSFRPNLFVRGVEALLGSCEVAGFEIARPLTTQPWGLRDFVVRDPDGHLIGVGERVGSED